MGKISPAPRPLTSRHFPKVIRLPRSTTPVHTPAVSSAPPLPENTSLAFIGEAEWSPAVITASQAKSLAATRNPAGRPNSDVLRSFAGKTGRLLRERWQIDFPAHYREQEAALHEMPFARLQKQIGRASGFWWINPHAQPPLRHALARLDRFLATPLDSPEPSWSWFESEHLPDASLLVVARDDDFTHAVLRSAAFTAWWRACFRKQTPTQVIESFPFPWPPATPLGSLTKDQQDFRSSVARAAISGDADQINSAVAAAYGWPSSGEEGEILTALHELHSQRCSRGR